MEYDYGDLIENLHTGLYFVDRERRITFWNKAAERITGFTAREVVGSSCSDNILIHVDQEGRNLCEKGCPFLSTIVDGLSREAEVFLQHKNGHRVPVLVRVSPLRDTDGAVIGGAELFSDMTYQESLSLKIEELEKLAYLDSLTRLANRRYAEMELESRFAEMTRCGLSFGVLLMDIDHFKDVNDTHGHDIGDRVLKTVAETMKCTARPYDIYGRWGGEEFIVIIRNVDIAVLSKIGERVRVLVEKTFVHITGGTVHVTVSIGAAMAKAEDNAQSLIDRADGLLYRSKKNGRNRLTAEPPASQA